MDGWMDGWKLEVFKWDDNMFQPLRTDVLVQQTANVLDLTLPELFREIKLCSSLNQTVIP